VWNFNGIKFTIVITNKSKKFMSQPNDPANTSGGSTEETPRKFEIAGGQDLPDNPHDKERMKPETAIIDLPDVSDIPGQENVAPLPMGELADVTASSDDEEGAGIFDDEQGDDDDLMMGTESDVSAGEKSDLEITDEDMPTTDDQNLRRASLDNTDDEGEDLNEAGFGKDLSGSDLDVSGAEIDDANEQIGEEDEENNPYSTPDNDDNDDNEIAQ
jgi:hypothetical protein